MRHGRRIVKAKFNMSELWVARKIGDIELFVDNRKAFSNHISNFFERIDMQILFKLCEIHVKLKWTMHIVIHAKKKFVGYKLFERFEGVEDEECVEFWVFLLVITENKINYKI